jgi:hypothetical protein
VIWLKVREFERLVPSEVFTEIRSVCESWQ